jgi:hypothetical protein
VQRAKHRHPTAATITLVGTIVSIVSGIVALIFLLAPGLKPADPSQKPVEAPAPETPTPETPSLSAKITRLEVDPAATYGDYVTRQSGEKSLAGLPQNERAKRGAIVSFLVDITGYRGEQLSYRWFLYDAASHVPIRQCGGRGIVPLAEDIEDKPQLLFMPLPAREGTYYIAVDVVWRRVRIGESKPTPPFSVPRASKASVWPLPGCP